MSDYLSELEAKLKAATPGGNPWHIDAVRAKWFGPTQEAEAIVASVNSLPWAIKMLREYTDLLKAMARRDHNLDEVWMEQYATHKLAELERGPKEGE